ncbi:hypothetical protein ACH4U7_38470 [Streptomyces sp. NPDC020845]|uniref:hypothetical protein n=1 Tax=Streptomyces sp. NPDC020845 TaxID=3365096 RepID=UPI00378844CA
MDATRSLIRRASRAATASAARRIAQRPGIDTVIAEVLPGDKGQGRRVAARRPQGRHGR